MEKQFSRTGGEDPMKIQRRSPNPFFYEGGDTAVLLVHGFTGTPSELRPLGQYLRDEGFTVYAPLLAGHGTSPEEMECTTWKDWWKSTLDAYERLKQEGVQQIVAAGLSMGGALVLNLARTVPLDGVIPMCAPIWLKDKRSHLVDVIRHVKPYLPRRETKPAHIEEHLVPYDKTPLKCVSSLRRLIRHVRFHLGEVEVPALIVQAEQDETVVPKSAIHIYNAIASKEKRISWYPKSSHIITLDKERIKLFQEVAHFVRRISGAAEEKKADAPAGGV
jgi:carboxylesterase